MRNRQLGSIVLLLVALAGLLAACGSGNANIMNGTAPVDPAAPADPTAAPTPIPTSLVVCLGEAPNTLYPYGQPNQSAQLILEALYDGPIDQRGYAFQPVIVEGLPDMTAGTAVLQTVQVQTGDQVVNNQGEVVELALGTFIRPAGCYSGACALPFDGQALEMDQMAALFTLRQGITWADGAPLTVADSIYGYTLNVDPATPASKFKVERTLSYEALDASTIKWTGIPGFIDPEYQDNFWQPAPQHLWGAIPAGELTTQELSARKPLGYGPFVLVDAGADSFTLQANQNYYRADEGLPRVDQVLFRVVGQDAETNLDMLRTGECDLLDRTAAAGFEHDEIMALAEAGEVQAAWANVSGWTLLNFGVAPQSYDDEYSMWAGDRPNFFGDAFIRKTLALCLDREAIAAEATAGIAPVMDSYLPPDHALFNPAVAVYRQDLETANDALEAYGWLLNGNGVRVASEIEGINNGTLFSVELLYQQHPENERPVALIREQLGDCGIEVKLVGMSGADLFATGPDAPVFGRNFDLAYFAWQSSDVPACHLFSGEAIPGADEKLFPYKWGGWNPTGWQNDAYDAACQLAQGSAPGIEAYAANHALVQQILSEELPVIPMYTNQQAALARPEVCGLDLDPTAGLLWNIEAVSVGEGCE